MIVTRADVGVAPYKRLGAFCRHRGPVPPRPGHCRWIGTSTSFQPADDISFRVRFPLGQASSACGDPFGIH